MSIHRRLEAVERALQPSEHCPLCAQRAAQQHTRADDLLRAVESCTYEIDCPQCGRPFAVQVDYVERAGG